MRSIILEILFFTERIFHISIRRVRNRDATSSTPPLARSAFSSASDTYSTASSPYSVKVKITSGGEASVWVEGTLGREKGSGVFCPALAGAEKVSGTHSELALRK
jgi:hypothetical protein